MQLLSTNTTSDDNLPAMSVDCWGPVLSKVHVGQTPPTRNNGEYVQLHPCEFEFSDLIVACMGPEILPVQCEWMSSFIGSLVPRLSPRTTEYWAGPGNEATRYRWH